MITVGYHSRAEGGCYFGEWPLLFAVSTNQPELVLIFLEFAERVLERTRAEMLELRDSISGDSQ
mgnify:CR=1 FL=1